MILYGAGGHARVVYDCLKSQGEELIGVFDDNAIIRSFSGVEVVSPYSPKQFSKDQLIISIGSNKSRYEIAKLVQHEFGIARHKSAFLAGNVEVHEGAVYFARSVIQVGSILGKHAIINSGAIVEHDCKIDDFAHIGPGAVICGNVSIGKGALIGANSTVLPGITIGKWAVVGAGAVVLEDVDDGMKAAGNPAKIISTSYENG